MKVYHILVGFTPEEMAEQITTWSNAGWDVEFLNLEWSINQMWALLSRPK